MLGSSDSFRIAYCSGPVFVMARRHWRNGNPVALLESKYTDEVPLLRF
jgi:hypothetical protein